METEGQKNQPRHGTVNFEKRKHPRFSVDLPLEYYIISSCTFLPVIVDPQNNIGQTFVGVTCKKGYLDTIRQLKYWSGQIRISAWLGTSRTDVPIVLDSLPRLESPSDVLLS